MLDYPQARADDVRALGRAIALGSTLGLALGVAYLGVAPRAAKPTAPVAVASLTPILAAAPAAIPSKTPAATPFLGTLRSRFALSMPSTPPAARPFRNAAVAEAPNDQDCLAEAVYFEARGESKEGQQAVAQVVLNRVRHPAFPKSVCGVVHQRVAANCQFAFACHAERPATGSLAWRRAETVASAALHGAVMAAVGDATHFQTASGGPFSGLMRVAQIGAHVFYRFAGHQGAAGMFHQTPVPSTEVAEADPAPVHVAAIAAKPAPEAAAATIDASKPATLAKAPDAAKPDAATPVRAETARPAAAPAPAEAKPVVKVASAS